MEKASRTLLIRSSPRSHHLRPTLAVTRVCVYSPGITEYNGYTVGYIIIWIFLSKPTTSDLDHHYQADKRTLQTFQLGNLIEITSRHNGLV